MSSSAWFTKVALSTRLAHSAAALGPIWRACLVLISFALGLAIAGTLAGQPAWALWFDFAPYLLAGALISSLVVVGLGLLRDEAELPASSNSTEWYPADLASEKYPAHQRQKIMERAQRHAPTKIGHRPRKSKLRHAYPPNQASRSMYPCLLPQMVPSGAGHHAPVHSTASSWPAKRSQSFPLDLVSEQHPLYLRVILADWADGRLQGHLISELFSSTPPASS
jgi:hypothetical protein